MLLRDLEFFIWVAETRSFRKAAMRADVTQPAITKGIKRLESELGLALLDRTRTGAELTGAGTAFLKRARQLRLNLDDALREASDIRSRHQGLLRIGVAPSLLVSFFLEGCAIFVVQRPAARFHLTIVLSDQLFAGLRRGDFDLVICTIPDTETPDITIQPIGHSPLLVVAGRFHPLLSMRRLGLEHLVNYQWILPRRGVVARDWLDGLFVSSELPLPSAKIELDTQTGALLSLTAHSELLSVAAGVSDADLHAAGLSVVPIPGLQWRRPVGALMRSDRAMSPLMQDFVRVLEKLKRDGI